MTEQLSKLQQTILKIAIRNRPERLACPTGGGADVYCHEVMQAFFGLRPTGWRAGPGRQPGSHRFSKQGVGAKRYASMQASLSRCLRRLEGKGLIERMMGASSHWSGGNLTQAGIELAEPLLSQPTQSPPPAINAGEQRYSQPSQRSSGSTRYPSP